MTAQSQSYLPEIDGLRALAVLTVILAHFDVPGLPGGYLGVDVFFVISGYVVTRSLLRSPDQTFWNYLANFYLRRIRRLAPALAVMVVLSAMAIRLFDPDPIMSIATGISALFGLSNIFLYFRGIDYFGFSAELNIFSHTWSLGVEEQFYLLFPPIIWLILARPAIRPVVTRRVFALVGTLSIASCAAFLWMYAENQPAAYFLMPFRFWELGLGSMIALSAAALPSGILGHSRTIQSIALSSVIAIMMVPSDFAPTWTTIGVVSGTAVAILMIHAGGASPGLLNARLSTYVGRASYSLYLWHWPIVSLSVWTVGLHLWLFPLQLVLTFVLGLASYHFVENPLRRSKWPKRRDLTAGIAIASLLACSVMAFASYRYRVPNFSGEAAEVEQRIAPIPGYVAKFSNREIDACFAEQVFAAPKTDWSERVENCRAHRAARPNLLFIGDSHAMDLFPMSDALFDQGIASVTNIFEPGCQVPARDGARPVCSFGKQAVEHFTNAREPGTDSFVVIRNNYAPRRLDGSLATFMAKLEAFTDHIASQGHRVIYVAPSPKYYGIGPTSLCSPQWFRPDWARAGKCENGLVEDRNEQLARRAEVFGALMDLQRRRSDFDVFDPFDALCGQRESLCSPFRGDALIHRDTSHVTETGSELLAKPFADFLSGLSAKE